MRLSIPKLRGVEQSFCGIPGCRFKIVHPKGLISSNEGGSFFKYDESVIIL